MADDKPNTGPKDNAPPEATAPPGPSDPPASEPFKSPNRPSVHEQAVISGMGRMFPLLPVRRLICLVSRPLPITRARNPSLPMWLISHRREPPLKNAVAVPRKSRLGCLRGKRRKRRSPAQAARLRLTRRPVRRPRPLFGTKCPEVRKLTRARKRAPAVRLCLNPLRR